MSKLNKIIIFFLKIFFYFARVIGIAPFVYCKNCQKFKINTFIEIYTIIFILLYIIIAPISTYKVLLLIFKISHLRLLQLVELIQYVAIYVSTTSIYLWLFYHRQEIINLINYGLTLINELSSYKTNNNYKKKFKYFMHCLVKCFLVQSLSFLTNIFNAHLMPHMTIIEIFNWIMIGLGIYPMWLLSITYFASLTLSTYFFRIINDQIKLLKHIAPTPLVSGMKRSSKYQQQLCDLSDEIDKYAILHDKVTKFTKNVNTLLSIPILVIFTNSFLSVVCQVSANQTLKKNFYLLFLFLYLKSFFTYSLITMLVKTKNLEYLSLISPSIVFCLYNFMELLSLTFISAKVTAKVNIKFKKKNNLKN